jgi:transcriptional regulator with XRE-family HTH domain
MGKGKSSTEPGALSIQLGKQIKTKLAADGAPSQNDVARASGIATGQLSEVLSGKKQFTMGQLDAVCYVLRLDMAKEIEAAETATDTRHLETDMTVLVDRP